MFTDKTDTILIKVVNKTIEIQKQSEEDALIEFTKEVAQFDPDLVFTVDIDEFFP